MSMSKKLSPQANFFIKAGVITVAVIIVMLVAVRLYQEYSRPEKASTEPTFLYVQTAHSGTLSDEQADGRRILKLNNVSPTTTYFSDRPDRITGHESTTEFIAQWSDGSDSFADNPPNAALDVMGADARSLAIVELMGATYDAQNKTLEYEVMMLNDESESTFPAAFDGVALFIDSTHQDYECRCKLSDGEDTCSCTYTYKLGATKTKEFRGYCRGNDLYPTTLHIDEKRKSTSCTVDFTWFDYHSRSCTNWDIINKDTIDVTVRCGK